MNRIKIFTFYFLIFSITSYAQKSRVGEIATFNTKINLISFNNLGNLNHNSIVEYDKPIAVFFWLSTCGPCIKELSTVNKMTAFKELKNQVRIIVISDDKPSNYQKAKYIAKNKAWEFELFFDKNYHLRNSLLNNWFGVPQVMILDKNKKIVLHKFGYRNGDEHKIIDKLKMLIHNNH